MTIIPGFLLNLLLTESHPTKGYRWVYTIPGNTSTAEWYDPRTGSYSARETYKNNELPVFDPPGQPAPGNDWVLVLDFK